MSESRLLWPVVIAGLALAGCAGMERDKGPRGDRLTAPQARSALAGTTFIGAAADGPATTLTFRRDGALVGAPEGAEESLGTWRMEDDYACLYQGERGEGCFGVYQVADDQYELIEEDGSVEWQLSVAE